MLARCGEQYKFRYLDGLRVKPGGAAIVGNAVDLAVSADLEARSKGEPLTEEAMRERADGTLRAAASEGVEFHADDKEQSVGELADRAIRLSLGYREKMAAFVPVERVARWFSLRLGDSEDTLNGRTDIETLDGGLADVKTRRRKPQPDEAASSDQLTNYALARHVLDKETKPMLTRRVGLHVIVDRSKTPSGILASDPAGVTVVALESERTPEHMAAYLERVERARDVIKAGAFMPARLGEPLCSERWCGYWSRCRFSRRPVAVAVSPGHGEE